MCGNTEFGLSFTCISKGWPQTWWSVCVFRSPDGKTKGITEIASEHLVFPDGGIGGGIDIRLSEHILKTEDSVLLPCLRPFLWAL